jgi:hypothetical protein
LFGLLEWLAQRGNAAGMEELVGRHRRGTLFDRQIAERTDAASVWVE